MTRGDQGEIVVSFVGSGGSCSPYFDRTNSHPSSRPSTQQRRMRRAATRRYSGLQKGHEGMEDERSGKNGG